LLKFQLIKYLGDKDIINTRKNEVTLSGTEINFSFRYHNGEKLTEVGSTLIINTHISTFSSITAMKKPSDHESIAS